MIAQSDIPTPHYHHHYHCLPSHRMNTSRRLDAKRPNLQGRTATPTHFLVFIFPSSVDISRTLSWLAISNACFRATNQT